MCPEIEELLRLAGIQAWSSRINQISAELTTDLNTGFTHLLDLDRLIPGLGQHNINEEDSDGELTGVYCIQDRPIFRGIQYVGSDLYTQPIEWQTHSIVENSCSHVEHSLKRKTGIKNLSMGTILKRIGPNGPLPLDLYDSLKLLTEKVYNKARHVIEHTDKNAHMFSLDDAIAVYLICRIFGARLLQGLGIKTESGQILFP
jgi:hypothetical protein